MILSGANRRLVNYRGQKSKIKIISYRSGDFLVLYEIFNLELFSTYAFTYAENTKDCLHSEAVLFSHKLLTTTVQFEKICR